MLLVEDAMLFFSLAHAESHAAPNVFLVEWHEMRGAEFSVRRRPAGTRRTASRKKFRRRFRDPSNRGTVLGNWRNPANKQQTRRVTSARAHLIQSEPT